jgi:hypothetical protein
MGQQVSREMSIDLFDLPVDYYAKLIRTSFTVRRTDGREQGGWQIPAVRDPDREATDRRMGNEDFVASHACRELRVKEECVPYDSRPWNVFMVRDQPMEEKDKKLWGWRKLNPQLPAPFWPTELTTEEEREAWKLEFCQKLSSLTVFFKKTQEQQAAARQLQDEIDRVADEAADAAGEYYISTWKEEGGKDEEIKTLFRFSSASVEAVVALLQSRISSNEQAAPVSLSD